ncbi:hypothetical protein GCM10007275_11160 [Jeotgalicoccus coquinae]|uniref:Multisubunit Na+/H+ antiporter MnhG subunit n=1 Tax=Jeotgalicoccus coquinae TaxID=709509 RepID=A0ABR6QKS1_9STAP|nr:MULTISPECIES: hypothetical protein [Jeotgalicoccus]MBB6422215.1 multisubunit Na+/H+ antiporter MnhG subunit [Jeotgalicoccus coquinae]GGE17731.1 hypothetical protein GCM10007275_11160 [Jeotgalicoccus coquinae]
MIVLIFINILYLLLVVVGIILFAYSFKNKRSVYAMLAVILILVPIIILTIGPSFLGLAPALSLLILMVIPPVGSIYISSNESNGLDKTT